MSSNPPEFDRLIDRCRDGNEQAWSELFQQFGEDVTRWAVRLDYLIREQDIQDLLVEVFSKVHRTLPRYRAEECPFRVWLYEQTAGVTIDNIRKRMADKRTPPGEVISIHSGESEQEPGVDPPDPTAAPDEIAAQKDAHRLLFDALDSLGPSESRCRKLIGLVYFGGFTYQEVAQALQIKAKTVSSALSKCLAELRGIAARIFSR